MKIKIKKINPEELKEILEKHRKWLNNQPDGERAFLRHIDLRGADLRGADLRCVNLRGVDLRGADLRDVNLRGVDLRDADLRGADLTDVNFTGTKTWDTNFINVSGKSIISLQLNTAVKNRLINYIPDIDWGSAGCFQGTLEDLENRVKITHKDNEKIRKRYEKAIEFIKFLAKDYKND